MKNLPILIVEDTIKFKKGQILEEYKKIDDGVKVLNDYLSESKYIVLTETLSKDDEKKVRDIVREQLRKMLWNFYTKSSILINN